jgi:hypothetical protein
MAGGQQQTSWIRGVTIAKAQVVKQINTMNQSDWLQRNEAPTWFNLLGINVAEPTNWVDVTDVDFIVDVGATFNTVVGGLSASGDTRVSLPGDYVTAFLPVTPLKLCLPGVSWKLLQVVALRQGRLVHDELFRYMQPGFGVFGGYDLNTQPLTLGDGGRFSVRIRFYRPTLRVPMLFRSRGAGLPLSMANSSPLVVWERLWKFSVPRQDAYDRETLTGMDPMPNAHTFSIMPQSPLSFLLTFEAPVTPFTVDYVTCYNPNVAGDMAHPLVGTLSDIRRDAFVAVTATTILVLCRQRCRLYIRLVDGNGDRLSWSDFRPGLEVTMPGYGF